MGTFTPHKPQEEVVIKVTKREAVLLQKLRRYAFGRITVHKANALIVRIEATDSEMIDEATELDKSLLK